jgi:hypothetical protein
MIILIAKQENASALHGMMIILIAQQGNENDDNFLIAKQENGSAPHRTMIIF